MSALTSAFLGAGRVQPAAAFGRVQGAGNGGARQAVCMAKKKGVRMIVTLECTEAKAEGATPSRYTTQKNKKNTPQRLELQKWNKYLRRMTLHREIK